MKKMFLLAAFLCLPVTSFGQAVVIAPHPDDEILGAAERMMQLKEAGTDIWIIFVTGGEAKEWGDPEENENYSEQRLGESHMAAEIIGIPEDKIIHLGFPDQGLAKLSDAVYESPYSLISATHDSAHWAGLPYTKGYLENALRVLLGRISPDETYYTSPHDAHPDHAAVGEVMRDLLAERAEAGYEYTIHNRHFYPPYPKPHPDSMKLHLIQLFMSQFHDALHQSYLEHFAAKPEIFTRFVPAI